MNEIGSIEPERLRLAVNIEKKEFNNFVGYLLKEGLIRNRYKFNCTNCGFNCIEYEKNILKGKCVCGECGKRFVFDEIKNMGHVVYEISYEDLMDLDIDEVCDDIELEIKVVSIDKEKEKIKEQKKVSNEKKRIFFGSSIEAKDTMYKIAGLIGAFPEFQTITWDSAGEGIFVAGDYTLESLIRIADVVDGAIFIFNADDETWYRNESKLNTTRDNVIFEYGLFVGVKGRKKVTFACKNKPHIATDLLGITYLDADLDQGVLRQRIQDWLQRF